MPLSDAIRQSVSTGFVDKTIKSLQEYQPCLLINDAKRNQKILTTITEELKKCDEFIICVAFITNSGVASLINVLEEVCKKGVEGKIVASQYQNFTEPLALRRLIAFPNLQVRIMTDSNMHTKGYIFRTGEKYTLVIGSSNLTQDALSRNYEWNIKLSSTVNGQIVDDTMAEFVRVFYSSDIVDETWIDEYSEIYHINRRYLHERAKSDAYRYDLQDVEYQRDVINLRRISPNSMQKEALSAIAHLRQNGKDKALIISATGTGKTYLSAFDAKVFNPRRLLFIIHRENIARAAMRSYRHVFGHDIEMGILSGTSKIKDEQFVFSTIQTISKDEVLFSFLRDYFDYIIIDEVHHIGARTYQKVISYFHPQFMLGMTATPERMDGYDIFSVFDHNIAYEIRLQRALEEDMLCPFHYYGVTDITVDDVLVEDERAFLRLTSDERVRHIIDKSQFYGCDNGNVRSLVFCSRNEISRELCRKFNSKGYRAIELSGEDNEEERERAIQRLETDDPEEKVEYIFTVDIFNEGVDIPRVNQIIMLRPTQSAIVFVQQLGRGLRRRPDKEYLTVIDFIGNYKKSYLVPIALYGDSSYNKDHIRRMMNGGNRFIPGASTVDFDEISRRRIYESIDNSNLSLLKDLKNDYSLLKYKLGRTPMMMDFVFVGSRDPMQYIKYARSFYNFTLDMNDVRINEMSSDQKKILEFISLEVANGKRIDDVFVLRELITYGKISYSDLRRNINDDIGISIDDDMIDSATRNINLRFATERLGGKIVSIAEKYSIAICTTHDQEISLTDQFQLHLKNPVFRKYLHDTISYSMHSVCSDLRRSSYHDGFILYKKYSRKDVFRILKWPQNPVAQNVGGYQISRDKSNCAIFVNYIKSEIISRTIQYEDKFLSRNMFQWMSKSRRTLSSPDIQDICDYRSSMRMPLFIKKHNDEGDEFYFISDTVPLIDRFVPSTIQSDTQGNNVSIVRMELLLKTPVHSDIFEYITSPQ